MLSELREKLTQDHEHKLCPRGPAVQLSRLPRVNASLLDLLAETEEYGNMLLAWIKGLDTRAWC